MLTAEILGASHAYNLTDAICQGETLVFVHGWLLSQAYWQPLIAQLAAEHRCLSYDLRGFGESALESSCATRLDNSAWPHEQRPLWADGLSYERRVAMPSGAEGFWPQAQENGAYRVSGYSLAAYAQDLNALLDYLGLEQVWLLGHSLGGSIALWAAFLWPERIKGVICINAGGGIYIPKEFDKFRSAGQQMVKYRPLWLASLPLLPLAFSRLMVHRPLGSRWGKQRLKDFVQADRNAAQGTLLESTTLEQVHLLPQLMARLRQPVHFITASEDRIMPSRYVRYLASFHRSFYQMSLVSELADCGHMAMLEQPEAVADVIRAVLAENGALADAKLRELADSASSDLPNGTLVGL